MQLDLPTYLKIWRHMWMLPKVSKVVVFLHWCRKCSWVLKFSRPRQQCTSKSWSEFLLDQLPPIRDFLNKVQLLQQKSQLLNGRCESTFLYGSTLGAVNKLCCLKIGTFWPPLPLVVFLLNMVCVVNRLSGYPPPPLPRRHSLWTAP